MATLVLDFTDAHLGHDPTAESGPLTRRERQILGLLTRGMSNIAIGQQLFISEKTVRNHLSSIYRKSGVASRGEAIARFAHVGAAGPGGPGQTSRTIPRQQAN